MKRSPFLFSLIFFSALMGLASTKAAAVVPTILSISPDEATQNTPGLTLTVNGTNFVSGCEVIWDGGTLPTTFISPTQVTAIVIPLYLTFLGSSTVAVYNPGFDQNSNTVIFNVDAATNPVPAVSAISPSSVSLNSPSVTMQITGTNFVQGSTAVWSDANTSFPLSTVFINSTWLTATIPAGDLTVGENASITVDNPTPGGGASNAATFSILNPVPAITALSPSSATVGSSGFTLQISGTDFDGLVQVDWNGTPLTVTNHTGPTEIMAIVDASELSSAGAASVTVTNPAPGGGTSHSFLFTVAASTTPVPVLSSINPSVVARGGGSFTLTANGNSFIPTSLVELNGLNLATTYVSGTQLTATVPAADIAVAGNDIVSIYTPGLGGGVSASLPFVVSSTITLPLISSLSPSTILAGSPGFTLTVNGNYYVSNAFVSWNGSALATTYIAPGVLTASVPAADIVSAGTATVTVTDPGIGVSSPFFFTIGTSNPPPMLTDVNPTSVYAGSPGFTLTVDGNNFAGGAVIQWNGVALNTTFVNATQLTANVPASDIVSVSTANITVLNPAPGGGTSSALPITINPNPVPTMSGLSPFQLQAGGPAFTLEVDGTNFVPTSVIHWNGNALTTTFINSKEVTAPVPAADIVTAGTATVTVSNPTPGGGTSAAGTFTILYPPEVLTSLSPSSATVGSPDTKVTINGSNITPNSIAFWNGQTLFNDFYVSPTQMYVIIPAADLATTQTTTINLINSDGTHSTNSLTFAVVSSGTVATNPAPAISSLSPNSVTAGGPSLTLTVNGSSFISGSIVQWNGSALATNFISANVLDATIPASAVASSGTATVTVFNPAPGGGTSSGVTFTISAPISLNPVPSIDPASSPRTVSAGGSAFTLNLLGHNFIPTSSILWNGIALPTIYVQSTVLTTVVPASDIVSVGVASVTVVNPAPGGGTSGILTITISSSTSVPPNPTPALTTLSPASITAGSPNLLVTINGSSFVSGALAYWNSQPLPTNFVAASIMTVTLPAADLASSGTASITVVNPAPGGGTSNALTFTVTASTIVIPPPPTPPTLSSFSPSAATMGDPSTSLTVSGSNFLSGSTVLWNGTALTTQFVSATQLTTSIPATDLAADGTPFVSVRNPDGTMSSALPFSIVDPPGQPQFVNVPAELPLDGSIQVTASGNVVRYVWTFTPTSGASGVLRSFAAGGTITAPTPTGTLALSQINGSLQLESYTITVVAINLANKQSSPSVPANVTIVASSALNSVRVYPNPWRRDRSKVSVITFDGLTDNSTVKIFTLSGHLVKTLPVSSGSTTWDMTTDSGSSAASGVYFYLISDGGSQKIHGEIAVIR